MANYIICKDKKPFQEIGDYNYCNLDDMILPDTIAYDSETTGLEARKCEIFCVQIGTGENNYIIVMYNNNYFFQELIPYIINKTLIGHNLLFDIGFMNKYGFYPKQVKDTLLASRILYNGDVFNIRHDFGTMMKRELNIFYDKTDQKNIHIVKLSQPSTIKYSFNDVDKLLEAHDVLEQKIIDGGFKDTYNLHCRYIRPLAYMEQCGMPISSLAWNNKMNVDIKNVKISTLKIEEYIYDNIPKFRDGQIDMFNDSKKLKLKITSPLQMIKVFKELKIEVKDKDGKDSINEDIISKSKHEFVSMWLSFQESNHRVSTFGDKILQKVENERIYTNFNPMVDTARLSCRKGNINFLNFPRDEETRNCFVANTGNVMVVCDYSGQENVICADFTGDEAMTAAVVNNKDLHCMFARVLFPEIAELTDEEIMSKHKSKRQDAKSPRFAFNYGGNAYTIHVNEGIPMDKAKEIEIAYKELHSGIYVWGDKVYNTAIVKGYIESVDGWKLKLPKYDIFKDLKSKVENISKEEWNIYKAGKLESNRLKLNPEYIIKNENSYNYYKGIKGTVSGFFKLKSEYQRLCLNSPIQTCGAHQIKLATCLLFEWIETNNLIGKVLINNSIYDELVLECEEYLGPIVAKNLSKFMQEGGNHYLTNLTIGADANIGSSWGKAK